MSAHPTDSVPISVENFDPLVVSVHTSANSIVPPVTTFVAPNSVVPDSSMGIIAKSNDGWKVVTKRNSPGKPASIGNPYASIFSCRMIMLFQLLMGGATLVGLVVNDFVLLDCEMVE